MIVDTVDVTLSPVNVSSCIIIGRNLGRNQVSISTTLGININPAGLLPRYQVKCLTHAVESGEVDGTVSNALK